MTTKRKTPARAPKLPVAPSEPLVLPTDKLSQAAWALVFVGGRAFRVLDVGPADKGVRFHAVNASSDLHVLMCVPWGGRQKIIDPARTLKGGCFELRSLKTLDGLGWAQEPATLSRTRGGLKIEGPVFGPRPLTIREDKDAAWPPPWPLLPDAAETTMVVTLDALRDRMEVGVPKEGLPGSMLAALAVVDRVTPTNVVVQRYRAPAALVLTGVGEGLAFEILMPLTVQTDRLVGAAP